MTTTIQKIKDALNAKDPIYAAADRISDLIYAAADRISDRLFEGHKASYLETMDIIPDKQDVRIQCRHWYNGGDYHDEFFTIGGGLLTEQVKIEKDLQNAREENAGISEEMLEAIEAMR